MLSSPRLLAWGSLVRGNESPSKWDFPQISAESSPTLSSIDPSPLHPFPLPCSPPSPPLPSQGHTGPSSECPGWDSRDAGMDPTLPGSSGLLRPVVCQGTFTWRGCGSRGGQGPGRAWQRWDLRTSWSQALGQVLHAPPPFISVEPGGRGSPAGTGCGSCSCFQPKPWPSSCPSLTFLHGALFS